MSRLHQIPIRIEGPALPGGPASADAPAALQEPPSVGLGGGVAAILVELLAMLERLATAQTPAAIDLRSLPMSPQDRTELKSALGNGEVRATVDAEGVSIIQETGISGVWWVEHRNRLGELIAEALEVTRVPEILSCASEEIAMGAKALREQMKAAPASTREARFE